MPMDGPALTARIPTPPWGDFADRHLVGIDEYVKTGGYSALQKALSMKPAEVVEAVKGAELRGRVPFLPLAEVGPMLRAIERTLGPDEARDADGEPLRPLLCADAEPSAGASAPKAAVGVFCRLALVPDGPPDVAEQGRQGTAAGRPPACRPRGPTRLRG